MKTAFLVSFSPMTRVVADVEDPDNLTDEEYGAIVAAARGQILRTPFAYLCGDNAETVTPDDECPYGTLTGEEA